MENLIYTILLALHNIALVGCVAGPFYMSRIVAKRSKYGKKIIYDMDALEEDVITSQPMFCWLFLIILYATGFGFPFVHLLFHGALKEFFSLRALRKKWCDVCLVLGILVLLVSPILRFY